MEIRLCLAVNSLYIDIYFELKKRGGRAPECPTSRIHQEGVLDGYNDHLFLLNQAS